MRGSLAAILIIVAIAAMACVPSIPAALTQAAAPTTRVPDTPTEYVPTALPITPTYEGCAYVWGTKDLPELTRKLNSSLQAISMDASGLAYAYGENCVYADGHSTFSAMETDFRVGVTVKAVRDEAALGNWIRKVMDIILAIPPDQLQGHNPGRVDFDFKQPDPAEIMVTVRIADYRSKAGKLQGAELFRLFYNNP